MAIEKRTINLLDPIGTPNDTWTTLYNWVFKIGRYLLLVIESLVLFVFFARFFLDKQNNDLTDEINDKVQILSNQTFRADEIKYRNLQTLFNDIETLNDNQIIQSSQIATIVSGIPNSLTLDKFTFNSRKVSMTLIASTLSAAKDYEFSLRQNPDYYNVTVTVSKSGLSSSEIEVSVSFLLYDPEEEG